MSIRISDEFMQIRELCAW